MNVQKLSAFSFLSAAVTAAAFTAILLFPLRCSADEPAEKSFSPYVETHSNGSIDWDRGIISGIGKGYIHLNGGSKGRALRAAQVLATGAIMKIASGIRLDDRNTLRKPGGGRVVLDLQALIRYEEAGTRMARDEKGEYFEVTRRAPLKGVEGLTVKLLDRFAARPGLWNTFPETGSQSDTADDASDLWLIIDARKVAADGGIRPALFPEVLTPDGERVYGVGDVERSALVRRGMARYVISDTPASQWGSAAEPGRKGIERMVDRLLSLWRNEAFAQAEKEEGDEESGRRRRRRRYIVTDATAAQGLMKTNLVISENDAKEIREADKSSKILKKCRVIVVANSPLGGIEGKMQDFPAEFLALKPEL